MVGVVEAELRNQEAGFASGRGCRPHCTLHCPLANEMLTIQVSEYYDTTIEGNKVAFDGAAIFSVLEGFYQHFLVPKRVETTFQWGSRSATDTLINLSVRANSDHNIEVEADFQNLGADHPLFGLLIVVGGVALFVFLLQRGQARDPKEAREAPRLD